MGQSLIEHSFDGDLTWSKGKAASGIAQEVLLANIPGATSCVLANERDDRNGTDWWVIQANGKRLSIDVKARQTDPIIQFNQDDLALEIWSDIDRKVIGWTRDPRKQSDYILWLFTSTGRWVFIPFPMLCKIFRAHWQKWETEYKTAIQSSRSGAKHWRSQCVFVPRQRIWRELYNTFGGNRRA